MTPEQELALIRAENERVSSSIARLGYEAVFVFGAPAAIVAFLYKTYSTSLPLLVFGLMCACSFLMSWIVFLRRLYPLRTKSQVLEKRIQDLNHMVKPRESV